MNELLEKALKLSAKANASKKADFSMDELEVVIAYLEGKLKARATMTVLGYENPGNVTHKITAVLKKAIEQGIAEIVIINKS